MSQNAVLEFDSLPSSLAAYAKAVKPQPGLQAGETVPRIEARINHLLVDPAELRKYRAVCGFPAKSTLPVTYPHVLAAPLHMAVVTHANFPVPLLGLVHVRNTINQHRPIAADEPLSITVSLEGHRKVDAGNEFDMNSVITVGDEVVWDSVTTFLQRQKTTKSKKNKRAPTQDTIEDPRYARFSLKEDLGRRYAAVSGDYNPIHLYALTAKLFGFKRHIVHGMWSLARCAAELDALLPDAYQYDVQFKLPVFLPCGTLMKYETNKDGIQLRLLDQKAVKPHLDAQVTFAN